MSLTPLSTPTPTPGWRHGRGGCGPKSIRSPKRNPCEPSYPDASHSEALRTPAMALTTPLLGSLGQSGT